MNPWLRGFLIGAAIVVISPVFVFITFFNDFFVKSGEMQPTLLAGELIYVNVRAKHAEPGDVIVFEARGDANKRLISRMLASGGDTVELRADVIYVNGSPVERVPVAGPCEYRGNDGTTHACRSFEERLNGHRFRVLFDAASRPSSGSATKVPAGEIWVMGDNRTAAEGFGVFIPSGHVFGKVRWIGSSKQRDRLFKRVE
jgi:signal peptidase I